MKTLGKIIVLLVMPFMAMANSHIKLDDTATGVIKLTIDSNFDVNGDSFSPFTAISRIGTGFSLFLTSTVYFSGFNLQNDSMGLITIRNTQTFEDRTSTSVMPFMAFMSVLGTSVFNYRTGTDNDVIAILPVVPTWGDSHFTRPSNNINFDYGFFLYFSKDF